MRTVAVSLRLGLVLFFSFAASVGDAQNLTDQVVAKAASPLIENKIVDGLSIGYIEGKDYGIVHLGSANSTGKSADNLTVYELGSLSKVFTSLLLADSVVRGEVKLDADANVTNAARLRLPSRDGRSIKWIDLSTHRSGLPRLPENLVATSLKNPYRAYDSTKAAAALAAYKLTKTPGDSQEYSNFGASVLGYLLAENAATTYQQMLRDRIAKPLRMSDCTVELTADQKKRFATPHDRVGSPALAWTFADLPGAGGVHATMRDMMRFAQAQLSPPKGTLGDAIDLAWKQHSAADSSGSATGLGWMIAGDGETRWHNGQTGGSHSALFINRGLKSAVVILCNTAEAKVDDLAIQLIQKTAERETSTKPMAGGNRDQSPPKLSPFTSVGFHETQAFVAYEGQVYQWLELNGIKLEDIVASSKKQFGEDWEKRICEDLVEVLWGMGHKPGNQVKLSLRDFKTKRDIEIKDAAMTRSNRSAVVQDRERAAAASPAKPGGDSVVVDPKTRRRLVGRYKLTANFIFDVKDQDGHLMVGITDQPTHEVFPESPTRWSYRGIDATLEFKLGRTGAARQLVLHQGGIKQTATRIGR